MKGFMNYVPVLYIYLSSVMSFIKCRIQSFNLALTSLFIHSSQYVTSKA